MIHTPGNCDEADRNVAGDAIGLVVVALDDNMLPSVQETFARQLDYS